jgi:hypothetical protein
MATDHTQHSRRPHGHRRRGHERRGAERRPRTPQQEDTGRDRGERDRADVDQIMREIRARIAERKGIDLSNQQILDLAARRLEAILAPQGLEPALMAELRRSAGAARPPQQPEPVEPFDEASLYESSNGLVRALRRLFRPLLSLLLEPKVLTGALAAQADLAAKQAAREAEQRGRQSEWNALHYEILRRVVTDAARAEIDLRDLLQRVESLAARVDFADRRVGAIEQAQHQARPARGAEAPVATVEGVEQAARPESDAGDGSRRRRRRRRGRRSGGGLQADGTMSDGGADAGGADLGSDADEGGDEGADVLPEASASDVPPEPTRSPALFDAPEAFGAAAASHPDAPSSAPEAASAPEAPPVSQGWVPPTRPEVTPPPMPETGPTPPSPVEAEPTGPAPEPRAPEGVREPAPGTDPDPSSTDR